VKLIPPSSGSWSNQVRPYQYYIHGSGPVTECVNLATSYKNLSDTASNQGVKIAIDSTSKWSSDMWRMELIPQTTAAINKGHVLPLLDQAVQHEYAKCNE